MTYSIPPLYPYSGYKFEFKESQHMYFFNSGRSAFYFAVNVLKAKNDNLIFLLPAYTCYSVVDVMNQSGVEYNFVDIDNSLQFDKNDLEQMLDLYSNKSVVLIPTALFGIRLKNYKKMYPSIKVIEDLSHSLIEYKYKESDFAFTSYGKGKMISAWGGGVLFGLDTEIDEYYTSLPYENFFLFSFIFTQIQKIISKYFWFLLEKSKYNPEKNLLHVSEEIAIKRLDKIKSAWIKGSLDKFDSNTTKETVFKYQNNISKEYQFELGEIMPYIRFPVKKKIFKSGISHIYSYTKTYAVARKKRKLELSGAKLLAHDVSFLPTHSLISKEYIKEIIYHVNS